MQIPEQKGRIAIVTGANTGIGEVTARELARVGARVYLACRSVEKGTSAMARIRSEVPDADLHFLRLDLGSFDSVREAAEEFLARGESLHLLVNNAGLAGTRGKTANGFEITFGVNHLGHFLFTLLLLDRLIDSGEARVVTVASRGHYGAEAVDFEALRESTRTPTGFPEYEVSKLANVLFSNELHRRTRGTGLSTFALHPGVVASDIWRRVPGPFRWLIKRFMISTDEGAETTLYCATEPALESGRYWDECATKKPSALALDEQLASELWQRSLEWTGAPDWPR